MSNFRFQFLFTSLFFLVSASAQQYPQNYFRNPLNIPMQLVANFGELRSNHWHMGLDIRTQQRENLPVHAAAEGYIAAVGIDAMGFGRAIYINHPNGLTTLYAHLNNFEPRLQAWVKEQQYQAERWAIKIEVPQHLFPVKKGQFIAYSGNTGGSQGPHVHFEIRETSTDRCLNPLLFGFPIADAVPPTLQRLAMYDRNKTVYAQAPQLLAVKKSGRNYALAASNTIRVGTSRISFAVGAVDRFSNSSNPNGIYAARIWMDGVLQSEFILDSIDYLETRYMNAHIDYRYKLAGGPYLQHLSRMPGDLTNIYTSTASNGVLELNDDALHKVQIELEDAKGNTSRLVFQVQYDQRLSQPGYEPGPEQFLPGYVNIFEREWFELYTTEKSVYDTANITYSLVDVANPNTASLAHIFLNHTIPVHDSITVRLKALEHIDASDRDRIIILNNSGTKKVVEKGIWNNGWVHAKFRQFGSFQALIDKTAPSINAPGVGDTIDLRRATQLVFSPKDDNKAIRMFRAEVDGQWLLFTNDKGLSFRYRFDNYFPRGVHELTVTVQDVAGNETRRSWWVRR